ncbi:DUF262 domain-containing protein [Serratia marcescens]|uniref:DUF262 domain-containing protein n=1 Tax=Serratia marcescens TaxID=615 RepID=UPI0023A9DC54|nr:DUF262 domain-containing protein [Serratia marcescens]WEA49933.1 DUF262 domain-containing protein [Serratia marcescens]HEJ0403691.1 DUF262 domain-containing protein [Serratia marcescens]HEJ7314472.1 DUF262 domain-containing protein [Serratia marcescens]
MSQQDVLQQEHEVIITEEEQDDTPFVEFDIAVSPADPTLELLVNQVNRGDIIIPFYQRNYVWKLEQASKLIESFLMGLPVPQIFLYVNDDDLLEVIDGQQRILSVKYFMDGYFGDEVKGKRQVFKLKGLSEISDYNGKTFSDLPPKDQRKIRNSTLRAIHIKQLKPNKRNDSVFHIFERLNTGGTQLKPQEIRNAVYRGPIVDILRELNSDPNWKIVLGLKGDDKSQRDVEFLLRVFSLYNSWEKYEKPMVRFLNVAMYEHREFISDKAIRFKARFPIVVKAIAENIKSPFRPRSVLNMAAMDSVMVALLENEEFSVEKLAGNYNSLFENEKFMDTISISTADVSVLQERFNLAREYFRREE